MNDPFKIAMNKGFYHRIFIYLCCQYFILLIMVASEMNGTNDLSIIFVLAAL